MKLYSVFSLDVVKKENKYFICKSTNKANIYIEFFTKEKIVATNDEVEALSKYYSILEVKDYTTGKVLKLTKKEILLKYLEINQQEKYIDGEEFLEMQEKDPEKAQKIFEDCLKESKTNKLTNSSIFTEVWDEQQLKKVKK